MSTPRFFQFRPRLVNPIGDLIDEPSEIKGKDYKIARLVSCRIPRAKWPDAASGVRFTIIPERVAEVLRQELDDSLRLTPVDMRNINPHLHADFQKEDLYLIWSHEQAETMRVNMGMLARFMPAQKTTNKDTFVCGSGDNSHLYCTIKLLCLARLHRWKDFLFFPMDLSPSLKHDENRIDFLAKKWPPKWYPDGFEPHPNNLTDEVPPDPLKK